MLCVYIAVYNRVKLQNTESKVFCGFKAVGDQRFTNMQAMRTIMYCKTGVGNMTAAPNVVWMQNIKAQNRMTFQIFCNCSIALRSEE